MIHSHSSRFMGNMPCNQSFRSNTKTVVYKYKYEQGLIYLKCILPEKNNYSTIKQKRGIRYPKRYLKSNFMSIMCICSIPLCTCNKAIIFLFRSTSVIERVISFVIRWSIDKPVHQIRFFPPGH